MNERQTLCIYLHMLWMVTIGGLEFVGLLIMNLINQTIPAIAPLIFSADSDFSLHALIVSNRDFCHGETLSS